MTKAIRLALISLMLPILGACSLVSNDSSRQNCAGQFDLNVLTEPLGPGLALSTTMRAALHDKQSVRMEELTRAAGWSDGWDLMAQVRSNTQTADLNGFTQTPGYCWDGLPRVKEPVPEGFYLFFKDHVPVQKVDWRGDSMPIQLRNNASLTPQSQLVVNGDRFAPA
ncbi:hypothetical protein ACFXHA_07160 [Nocardia sp. NPDC059240]|uniref:hypothetical protein n=1 Tax=Nocardia sp. NPDC059240 TaxID=3346786 RepID=UPI00368BA8A5